MRLETTPESSTQSFTFKYQHGPKTQHLYRLSVRQGVGTISKQRQIYRLRLTSVTILHSFQHILLYIEVLKEQGTVVVHSCLFTKCTSPGICSPKATPGPPFLFPLHKLVHSLHPQQNAALCWTDTVACLCSLFSALPVRLNSQPPSLTGRPNPFPSSSL